MTINEVVKWIMLIAWIVFGIAWSISVAYAVTSYLEIKEDDE